MRKYNVKCKIEGEITQAKADIQQSVNFYYAQNIGKILKKADLSKEEKIEIVEEIKKNIKKILK
ncbi:MAG: hypothetical protein NC231_07195 [Bacillus sp. (in: Bacteria)]|nr:hypothetical protein [Bacillus sp. (in: firmicutes)]MCM1426447.1 hypothetical protein [Eubacterium sp.]